MRIVALAALALAISVPPALAQDTKVAIGISGWTGFAPLTLANEAGIFAKNGLDVSIKKIPQASRHLAIASGDIQCAATTVETWVVWNANGVPTKQIFQLDKSYGADGMAVKNDIAAIRDLKGKTVAASAPGTAPYFTLAWFLKKNGLSVKDVRVVNLEPGPAAQAFLAGQNDAAMTYEPYLSSVRAAPQAGKIIATTLDYPMIMDTFGCTPKFLEENPKAAKAGRQLLRSRRDDWQGPGQGVRDHGGGRQADGRSLREVRLVPPLAGPGGQQGVLRGRVRDVLQRGGGSSPGDWHHQGEAGHQGDRGYAIHSVGPASPSLYHRVIPAEAPDRVPGKLRGEPGPLGRSRPPDPPLLRRAVPGSRGARPGRTRCR
jgi:NitT/TauT family transport system substrate-binding protein